MAFARDQLERVAGGLKKLSIYDAGADATATVTAAGYFTPVASEMDAGDIIIAATGNRAAVVILCVTSARGVTPTTVVANA